MSTQFKIIIVDDGFLGKYIERELSAHPVSPGQEAELVASGGFAANVAADVVVDATGRLTEFSAGCRSISLGETPAVTAHIRLRLPAVVGTGLGGQLLKMARMIDDGLYFNVGGSRAKMTVVHAVSVAAAVRLAIKMGEVEGDWLLTDGVDPLRSEVASALAERLGQKRIYTLSLKWHKVLAHLGDMLPGVPYSTSLLTELTANALVGGRSFSEACPEWKPVDTVEYLKTHDYSNEDF